MSDLTDEGRAAIRDLSYRYGISEQAVESMARAVSNGGGTMAQFNIPELGGGGQWMAGGMTMVGDMFNNGLKNTVENLCGELSNIMAQRSFFRRAQTLSGSAWWPESLGSPSSVGGQNQTRYAYFPQARRIAFDPGNGQPLILLDTLDNQIGGFSQQQSGPGDPFAGITFSSQYGQYPLSSLPRIQPAGSQQPPEQQPAYQQPDPEPAPQNPAPVQQQQPEFAPQPAFVEQPNRQPAPDTAAADHILSTIERLAKLRDAGALSDEEYAAKKSELLARL